MSRIDDDRIIGNILGLMHKIIDEKKSDPTIENLLPAKRAKFYCRKMKISVSVCNVQDCKLFGVCSQKS